MTMSLRTRLLSGIIVGTAVLLGLFCITVHAVTRRTMTARFDESLLSTARMLSAVTEEEEAEGQAAESDDDEGEEAGELGSGVDFEFDVRMTPEFNDRGGACYVFYAPDGSVVIRSPSAGEGDLSAFGDVSVQAAYQRCILPGGRPGRAICYRFGLLRPPGKDEGAEVHETYAMVVGRDAGDLYGFLGFLGWLLAGCSAGIVILSAAVGAVVIRGGLRPVHTLAGEIESVDAQSLEKTFATAACPAELMPICKRLNEMMDRLRSSFERQRRFNADVAHELRTPLAGIQSTMEVCLRSPRQAKQYEEALAACLKITRAMHRMVDTLLDLARLDARRISLKPETIHLRLLVDDTWRLFADRAFDRRVAFQNLVDDAVVCICDRDHFAMILSNILDNAAEYCDEGGQIVVEAESTSAGTALAVANTASRLTEADARHVFDFFWRADPARTDTGLHCGIGLNVVARLAAILGIRVEAKRQPSGMFTIQLHLPTRPAPRT